MSAVERMARARVRGVVERVAEQVREEVPGVTVEAGADRVVISGRGLRGRIGWIGGMLR